MGEHCAKVYNKVYNKESYASYETDNELLISERNVHKTCQEEEGEIILNSSHSEFLKKVSPKIIRNIK